VVGKRISLDVDFPVYVHGAYDAFYRAAWSQGWRASSYYKLAEISCLNKKYSEAMDFIGRSLSLNLLNLRARNLKTALLRKTGKRNEASAISAEILSVDPLNFWAANERYLQSKESGDAKKAADCLADLKMRMRDDVQNYLELAVDYGNCGLWDEAVDVLSRLEGQESGFPMVYYYLGYYWFQKGEASKAVQYFF